MHQIFKLRLCSPSEPAVISNQLSPRRHQKRSTQIRCKAAGATLREKNPIPFVSTMTLSSSIQPKPMPPIASTLPLTPSLSSLRKVTLSTNGATESGTTLFGYMIQE